AAVTGAARHIVLAVAPAGGPAAIIVTEVPADRTDGTGAGGRTGQVGVGPLELAAVAILAGIDAAIAAMRHLGRGKAAIAEAVRIGARPPWRALLDRAGGAGVEALGNHWWAGAAGEADERDWRQDSHGQNLARTEAPREPPPSHGVTISATREG